MLLISYDIKNDKLRTKFNKFITKYGVRVQYSVYKIKNSNRVLNLILFEIEKEYKSKFSEEDSVLIYKIKESDLIAKYGNAIHLDEDYILLL